MAAVDPWPFFGLTVTTPRLQLRVPDDALLAELATLTRQPIHDPALMPFCVPWTDLPPDERVLSTLQFQWRCRGELSPASWRVSFVVLVDGRVLGGQDLYAQNFAATRTVSTGSWLTQSVQGQGLGREMRAAVLHLAFAGLGADRADTAAFADNGASQAVTRVMGYEPNGHEVVVRRGQPALLHRFTLARGRWAENRRDDITIEGLDPCRPLLGVRGWHAVSDGSSRGLDGDGGRGNPRHAARHLPG